MCVQCREQFWQLIYALTQINYLPSLALEMINFNTRLSFAYEALHLWLLAPKASCRLSQRLSFSCLLPSARGPRSRVRGRPPASLLPSLPASAAGEHAPGSVQSPPLGTLPAPGWSPRASAPWGRCRLSSCPCCYCLGMFGARFGFGQTPQLPPQVHLGFGIFLT